MEQSGVAIGASFARGIASQASLVASSANALMAAARAFFPNSPADEGPFSGSGWVDRSGFAIGEGFAKGLSESSGVVIDATDSMMRQVSDLLNEPQSAEGLQQILSLQSQMSDLQKVGASDAQKAELDRLKDFNSLIQQRIKLRESELKTVTSLNDMEVKAWSDQSKNASDTKKGVGQQAQAMKDAFKDSLEPLTAITPDLLMGGGKSTIFNAGEVDSITAAELETLRVKQQQLDMQAQLMKLQLKGGAENPEMKKQLALLDAQKQRLALQSEELEYWSKYVDTGRDVQEAWAKAGDDMIGKSMGIARSTGMSYLNELGVSGNGMIPNLLEEGSRYIFQVSGIDDALSLQKNLVNQKTLGVVGR
jgi:hypothetical protein